MFESLKGGQGLRKVICSFGRIQKGLVHVWQVFIYTLSSVLTQFHFSSLLSFPGGNSMHLLPFENMCFASREETVYKE